MNTKLANEIKRRAAKAGIDPAKVVVATVGTPEPAAPAADTPKADARDLCGNRALAFFANRLWHQTYDEKYPSKDKCGRIICRTLAQVWDNCPMTGMWLDCDALQPLADFMQGKGDHKGRTLRAFNSTTVESVVRDCFRSLLAELDRDCEYCSSQEYFAEEAEANDYQFTDDGDRFTKAA